MNNGKKTRKIKAIIIIIVLVVLGLIAGGIFAYRYVRVSNLLHEQNYVASKLIELGEYTQGSILATKNEQMKKNAVSEQLIVLAAGLQGDYDIGKLYADTYLAKVDDEIILSAKTVFDNYQSELEKMTETEEYIDSEQQIVLQQETYDELLGLLLDVQGNIPVKKKGETLNAIADYMMGMGIDSNLQEKLEDDNSLMAKKVLTQQELAVGNYESAVEKLEDLVAADGSFENRAMLANVVSASGVNMTEDAQVMRYRTEQNELSQRMYELQEKQNQETNAVKRRELEEKILELQEKIQELEEKVKRIPVLKAINYIETTTPLTDKHTTAYKVELAQLYYQANDEEQSREYLRDLINDTDDSVEPANMLFQTMKKLYLARNSEEMQNVFVAGESSSLDEVWNQLANLLGFQGNYYYYYDNDFYQFVMSTFDQVYNGLIIRSIDATNFPNVKVTINVAMDIEEQLRKSDLTVEELEAPLNDFKLIALDEVEATEKMTVELVVDKSGSMAGEPMSDTQQAVSNFIKNLDESIQVGVVAFDNDAEVISTISNNHNSSLRAVNSLYADGGTNIYSGLKLAGQELESSIGRRVIILMSDGMDGSAGIIDEVLDDLKRKNIYVYTIAFGGADADYLTYIAKQCGGKCIQAESSQMLSEIYATIGQYMVNDYMIEFTAVKDLEDYSRNIKITFDKKDAFAQKDYNVGVSLEEILSEEGVRPLANYFQEVGGSDMNTEE